MSEKLIEERLSHLERCCLDNHNNGLRLRHNIHWLFSESRALFLSNTSAVAARYGRYLVCHRAKRIYLIFPKFTGKTQPQVLRGLKVYASSRRGLYGRDKTLYKAKSDANVIAEFSSGKMYKFIPSRFREDDE